MPLLAADAAGGRLFDDQWPRQHESVRRRVLAAETLFHHSMRHGCTSTARRSVSHRRRHIKGRWIHLPLAIYMRRLAGLLAR